MYDLKSDYVLLVFWASWCPHCVQEIPRLKMVLEQLKDKKIAVVFISLDEEESAWKSFIYQQKLDNYIHLCDFKKWKMAKWSKCIMCMLRLQCICWIKKRRYLQNPYLQSS